MPDRIFEDDPTISNDERLLRRIHPSHVDWDADGQPNISSAAFKAVELSVNLASVMEKAGRNPNDTLLGQAGFGLAAITAGQARAQHQLVVRDPTEEEPAHGLVCGEKKRGNICRKLRDGAHWLVAPSR
jgi:hypothetical protein